jgi:hypothetical protein
METISYPQKFEEALPMKFTLFMSARLSEMGIKNSEIKDVKLGANNFFVELEGTKGKFLWKKHYFVRFIFSDYRNPKVYDIVTRRIYK